MPHQENLFRRQEGLEGKFVLMYSGNMSPAHPLDTILEASLCFAEPSRSGVCFCGRRFGPWCRSSSIAITRRTSPLFASYQPLE